MLTVLERAQARANAPVFVCALMCLRSLVQVYTRARASVSAFSGKFQRVHRSAALFDRALGPGRPANLNAARKAIARDGAAGREHGAGGCGEEQAVATTVTAAYTDFRLFSLSLSLSLCCLPLPPSLFLPPSLPPSFPPSLLPSLSLPACLPAYPPASLPLQNSIYWPSNILHTPSNILSAPSNILHTTKNNQCM